MVACNSKIYQATKDINDRIFMRMSTDNGATWNSWYSNPKESAGEIGMVCDTGKVIQTMKVSNEGQNYIYIRYIYTQ